MNSCRLRMKGEERSLEVPCPFLLLSILYRVKPTRGYGQSGRFVRRNCGDCLSIVDKKESAPRRALLFPVFAVGTLFELIIRKGFCVAQ